MLELVNVVKSYEWPGEAGSLRVLKDITLKVVEGESIAIVGPSGSGKSTLLNIIVLWTIQLRGVCYLTATTWPSWMSLNSQGFGTKK